ncbi:MarR family transcriptional regulator [Mycetocola tolaasinivorans]|uniref:MarR family transcriptional regulator n=1 Tax=Mycetocola tolaasinivorans TaxID=76635 RepID=A0A3L7A1X6_9MICO|nr:MarR family transcriptional regulator [Mycetocola tolaasinivorans]RLP74296.1 MarR family transcriptional regulator [Mycetocola tolaasinivorans]
MTSEPQITPGDLETDAQFRAWFVDSFAGFWQGGGGTRTGGRIAGYLLLSDADGVSADELSRELDISRGSVSSHVRKLEQGGFVHRVRRPGARTHYFTMDADVWGGFLKQEQTYLANQRTLAEQALARVSPGGLAQERVRNMRDYMGWMLDNRALDTEWARFKAERDSRPA